MSDSTLHIGTLASNNVNNIVNDSSSNAKLKGTWSVAFQSSSSSYTFIPSYSVSYYYEYGD